MRVSEGLLTRRGFCAAGAGLATIGFSRLAVAAEGETGPMITQLAKFKLNMEKEADGLQALKELCTAVEENEPGVLAYICHRSVKNPDELVFFEVYKDEDALKAHGKSPHMGKMRTAFATLFRPPLEVTRLDRIGGFAR
ncbi:MAG TPA: putative quinol monooxygenase [Pirellulales bacterium]|jgi:quinol monooxygenase YgiN|nr:putative quinol monooxygenase [Pirellulales bacterium]